MNICSLLLKIAGWKVDVSVPDMPKCVICVAPHTSNWDFIIGKLAYSSIGRTAAFLMKSSWFFFPLGYFFKAIGGVPVVRSKKGPSLVEQLVARFKTQDSLHLAITPEGTRSRNPNWHTGFLQIATQAKVPCVLAAIDFAKRCVYLNKVFMPTGNIDADMKQIKEYYRQFTAMYPSKFAIN